MSDNTANNLATLLTLMELIKPQNEAEAEMMRKTFLLDDDTDQCFWEYVEAR
jgi:hypothetical protein